MINHVKKCPHLKKSHNLKNGRWEGVKDIDVVVAHLLVNFEQISHLFLMFLLLTLNK